MSSKRTRNNGNRNLASNGTANTSRKRQTLMNTSNNEPRELIITDYNPFDVYEVNDAGNVLQIITEQINPVKLSDDKHFFYPSSFVYNNTDSLVFAPALCIHKFKHNDYTPAPPSYKLHPIALDILENRGLNKQDVISAFRKINAGQTLLIKLPESDSITWKELDELKRKYVFENDGYNYSVLHNTSVRIGDSNSVFEITPSYELPEPIPAEEEVTRNNEGIENQTSMYGETVGMGEAFSDSWSSNMATQPGNYYGNENFPPKIMDGTPGTPTQKITQTNQPHQPHQQPFVSIGGSYSRTKRAKRTKRTKRIKQAKQTKRKPLTKRKK